MTGEPSLGVLTGDSDISETVEGALLSTDGATLPRKLPERLFLRLLRGVKVFLKLSLNFLEKDLEPA